MYRGTTLVADLLEEATGSERFGPLEVFFVEPAEGHFGGDVQASRDEFDELRGDPCEEVVFFGFVEVGKPGVPGGGVVDVDVTLGFGFFKAVGEVDVWFVK